MNQTDFYRAPGYNVYAPVAYNGLSGQTVPDYVDIDFSYVYDVVLTANQRLNDQSVSIRNDADYEWRALILSEYEGSFRIRFSDASGYYLSQGLINSSNFLDNNAPLPWPVLPGVLFPSGGRIGIDIQDLSGAENTIQLVFRGVNRYRLPK